MCCGIGLPALSAYSGRMKKLIALVGLVVSLAAPAMAQEFTPLIIVSGDKTHEFQVELADDEAERALGLMHREEMAQDRGMLFTYEQPQRSSVWMKNTLIPLDMLFLGADGTIVAIAKNAEPGSLRTINSGFPSQGFLEINGGQADVLAIKPGDIVRHKALGNWEDEEN